MSSRTRRDPDTVEFACQECGARCSIHKATELELGHNEGCSARPAFLAIPSTEEAV